MANPLLDESATLSHLREQVCKFRDERDWLKFNNPKDLSVAISIEAAELLELFLWKDELTAELVKRNRTQLLRVQEEMADVAIYLLSLSDVLKVDLAKAITNKLDSNALKYPVSKSRGKAAKYDELT
jgi:dCTP diphosphatase